MIGRLRYKPTSFIRKGNPHENRVHIPKKNERVTSKRFHLLITLPCNTERNCRASGLTKRRNPTLELLLVGATGVADK